MAGAYCPPNKGQMKTAVRAAIVEKLKKKKK